MLKRDPEAVIRAYESGQVSQTEATLAQYVKALVEVDRLDHSKLMSHLRRGVGGGGGSGSSAMQDAALRFGAGRGGSRGGFLGGGGGGGGGGGSMGEMGSLGSELNPIVVTTAEPGFKAQFWKVIRTLGGMFILVSGVNALLETPGGAGGISRGLMGGSPEPQPAQLSNVTFKDVKVRRPRAPLENMRTPGAASASSHHLTRTVCVCALPMLLCCCARAWTRPSQSWRRSWRTCATPASSPSWVASCPRGCCWCALRPCPVLSPRTTHTHTHRVWGRHCVLRTV